MDSINKNQPETNEEHLQGPEAIGKLKEMIDKSSSCFFSTSAPVGFT